MWSVPHTTMRSLLSSCVDPLMHALRRVDDGPSQPVYPCGGVCVRKSHRITRSHKNSGYTLRHTRHRPMSVPQAREFAHGIPCLHNTIVIISKPIFQACCVQRGDGIWLWNPGRSKLPTTRLSWSAQHCTIRSSTCVWGGCPQSSKTAYHFFIKKGFNCISFNIRFAI